MQKEAHKTLTNILYSLSIEDMQDELKAAIKDKNPLLRANTVEFIRKILSHLV